MNRTRAFTLVELLVVIVIIALLIGLLLPALAKARKNAASLKDKTQIQQIHKGTITFANENKDRMPVPGQINRLADAGLGQQIPGLGDEDFTLNWTAPLFSALIAQQFFNPELCLGTTEVNPKVRMKQDYNFSAYNVSADNYWDTTFVSDLALVSNTSYAHMSLVGNRKKLNWRNNQSSGVAAFGTRGTGGTYGPQALGGAVTGNEYDRSPTLQLHGPSQQWFGHVCFNDNHTETLDTFFAPLSVYIAANSNNPTKDNIFAAEFNETASGPQAAGDNWMTISTASQLSGGVQAVTPVWDDLYQ
jgi:prepilin-type N-terminal cleavage/methylation domain-containing protein